MRPGIVFLFAVSLTPAFAAPALADPMGDLEAARKAFTALRSVHAEVGMRNGQQLELDIVKPHKFRATTPMGQMVSDGTNMWINMSGRWMKVPTSGRESILASLDESQSAGQMAKIRKDCTARNAGAAVVAAVASIKYALTCKNNDEPADVWVGPGHLPVRIQVNKGSDATTITYSRYNSVPDFAMP